MKIIKVNDDNISLWDLRDKINSKNVEDGGRFGISWKVKKKRKLKSYRLVKVGFGNCESCGHYTTLTLQKGKTEKTFDNHFGIASVSITSL